MRQRIPYDLSRGLRPCSQLLVLQYRRKNSTTVAHQQQSTLSARGILQIARAWLPIGRRKGTCLMIELKGTINIRNSTGLDA